MRISDWSSDVCSSDLHDYGKCHLLAILGRYWPTSSHHIVCLVDDADLASQNKYPALNAIVCRDLYTLLRQITRPVPCCHIQETQIGRASCRERVCQYV